MAAKAAAPDYSKWTFQELDASGNPVQAAPPQPTPSPGQAIVQDAIPKGLQVVAPPAQPAAPPPPPLPDMTKQDPHTFAVLSANQATSAMPKPMVEDFKKVYEDALGKAIDYRKTLQTQFSQQQSELEKAQILQQSAAKTDIQKAATIKAGDIAQEEDKAQRAEGLTPDQAQQLWEAAGNKGKAPLIKALPTTEYDKAMGFVSGYKNTSDLHDAFNGMIKNTFGSGGVFNVGQDVAGATSPQARIFNSVLDSSLVPLARGVFGDTGATAGKDLIQAQMKDSLPNITDNENSGGQKIYMLKKRIRDNLQTQASALAGHFDTTMLDSQIRGMNDDLTKLDRFNPIKDPVNVVQQGTSPQGNATMINHLNNAAAAQSGQPQQPQQPQQQQQQPNQPLPAFDYSALSGSD